MLRHPRDPRTYTLFPYTTLSPPPDLVLIGRRGVVHGHSAHHHWLQPRDGSQRAGAAHLYVDCVQHRLRAFRREFVRDRPTRGLGDLAEPLLPVQPVHLVDDAVDVERQIGPPPLDTAIMIDDLLPRGDDLQIVRSEEHTTEHQSTMRISY